MDTKEIPSTEPGNRRQPERSRLRKSRHETRKDTHPATPHPQETRTLPAGTPPTAATRTSAATPPSPRFPEPHPELLVDGRVHDRVDRRLPPAVNSSTRTATSCGSRPRKAATPSPAPTRSIMAPCPLPRGRQRHRAPVRAESVHRAPSFGQRAPARLGAPGRRVLPCHRVRPPGRVLGPGQVEQQRDGHRAPHGRRASPFRPLPGPAERPRSVRTPPLRLGRTRRSGSSGRRSARAWRRRRAGSEGAVSWSPADCSRACRLVGAVRPGWASASGEATPIGVRVWVLGGPECAEGDAESVAAVGVGDLDPVGVHELGDVLGGAVASQVCGVHAYRVCGVSGRC